MVQGCGPAAGVWPGCRCLPVLGVRCRLSSFHPPRYPWRLGVTVPLLETRKLGFGYSRTHKRSRELSGPQSDGGVACICLHEEKAAQEGLGLLGALVKYTAKWDLIFLPL